jgi:hypothetical protein
MSFNKFNSRLLQDAAHYDGSGPAVLLGRTYPTVSLREIDRRSLSLIDRLDLAIDFLGKKIATAHPTLPQACVTFYLDPNRYDSPASLQKHRDELAAKRDAFEAQWREWRTRAATAAPVVSTESTVAAAVDHGRTADSIAAVRAAEPERETASIVEDAQGLLFEVRTHDPITRREVRQRFQAMVNQLNLDYSRALEPAE